VNIVMAAAESSEGGASPTAALVVMAVIALVAWIVGDR